MASTSIDRHHFLLGTKPTDDDKVMNGARLPTSRQVLLCFMAHHSETVTVREAANITTDTVLLFYQRARIPTIATTKMAAAIIKLFMEMKELQKINVAERKKDKNSKQQQRIVVFKEKLEKTMKFWPRDALDRIPIEEDRQFLISMMGHRGAAMAGTDELLHSTEQKVHQRKESEEERLRKEQVRQETVAAAAQALAQALAQVPHAENEEIREDEPEPTTPVRSHKRVVKTGSPAFWPHDVMRHPAVVETATRNKVSGTTLSALTHSFVTATSGDHSKINIHAKTAYKYTSEY